MARGNRHCSGGGSASSRHGALAAKAEPAGIPGKPNCLGESDGPAQSGPEKAKYVVSSWNKQMLIYCMKTGGYDAGFLF